MAATYSNTYNRRREVIYLDTYVPQTSRALADMEQFITLRLDYFTSRLRAALRDIIGEPDKWDHDWVMENLDTECVSLQW